MEFIIKRFDETDDVVAMGENVSKYEETIAPVLASHLRPPWSCSLKSTVTASDTAADKLKEDDLIRSENTALHPGLKTSMKYFWRSSVAPARTCTLP